MTQTRLNNIAEYYVQRYASSCENLRRVLLRRADKSIRVHGGDREDIKQWIDATVTRMTRAVYWTTNVLHWAGPPRFEGLAGLRQKSALSLRQSVDRSIVDKVLAETATTETGEDAALEAARAYARRRRLGPYSTTHASPG